MTDNPFAPAQRGQVYLKIALSGVTGSGKTFGALLLAQGIVGAAGRFALADSEGGRASLYAGSGDQGGIAQFDTLRIKRPFSPYKYIEAIERAIDNGYDALVLDSLSHAWSADGGVLDEKERLDEEEGESFSNWRFAKKPHSELVLALLGSPIHIIATMRTRMDYLFEKNGDKTVVRKLGLGPVQDKDLPYEFDVILDLAEDYSVTVGKDRTRVLPRRFSHLTIEHGAQLRQWLETADPVPGQPAQMFDAVPAPLPASTLLKFTVQQTVDRTQDGKVYTLLIGDDLVLCVARLTHSKVESLKMAVGRVEAQATTNGGTIRVGDRQLPLYYADQWKPVVSQTGQLEVSRNGR